MNALTACTHNAAHTTFIFELSCVANGTQVGNVCLCVGRGDVRHTTSWSMIILSRYLDGGGDILNRGADLSSKRKYRTLHNYFLVWGSCSAFHTYVSVISGSTFVCFTLTLVAYSGVHIYNSLNTYVYVTNGI